MSHLQETVCVMRERKLVLCTAESCTGGMVAATLADVPGTEALVDRAYVVYSVAAKQAVLGVRASTIDAYGVASVEVASEMAQGALAASPEANVAIANTEVSPEAGEDGCVQCIAWAHRHPFDEGRIEVHTERRRFRGDRHSIRKSVAMYALERLPHYTKQVYLEPA